MFGRCFYGWIIKYCIYFSGGNQSDYQSEKSNRRGECKRGKYSIADADWLFLGFYGNYNAKSVLSQRWLRHSFLTNFCRCY